MTRYFAKRLKRVESGAWCAALIEIKTYVGGQIYTVEFILYRFRLPENEHGKEKYEMIRFLSSKLKEAEDSFLYSLEGYPGLVESWKETTDWLKNIAEPIHDKGLQIVYYPEEKNIGKNCDQQVLICR